MKKLLSVCLLLLTLVFFFSAAGQNNPATAQNSPAAGQNNPAAGQINPPIVSGDLIHEGTVLYDSGAYRKAIPVFEKIDGNDTNYVRALYGISLCYFADSQFNKSVAYCEKALALDSDPEKVPDVYNQYANSVDAAGDPARALRIFDTAIAKYPAYSLLYLNKGTVLFRQKHYAQAEAVFQQALLIDPYSYSSHYKLGLSALNQGKLIPAFLSLMGYLLASPEGKYHSSCLNLLNALSKNTDEVQGLVNGRKVTPSENYQLLEQIVQSKIALDKNYKPLIQLDDVISRQMQAILEKIEYQESDPDFYMQYYVPYFKACFSNGQFELLVNHLFFSADLPILKEYRRKNKKELSTFVEAAAGYLSLIRSSRELNYKKRDTVSLIWTFSNGELTGHGKYRAKDDKLLGPWEFYYATGNLKASGTYNDQGKREGPRVYYYFNGQIKGREIYADGKQTGEETYYFSNGSVSTHSWYKNDQPDGESYAYFLTGSVRTITHYQAGKIDGTKLSCLDNGDSNLLENYSAGVLNGPAQSWYANKKTDVLLQYKNGKEDGLYQKYFENGRLSIQGNYVMGKQEGLWKYYFPNGQLKDEQNFVNDKQEGAIKVYNDNGVLIDSYVFRHGKIDGEDRYYDEDGKLYAIYTYGNDVLQKAQFFDKKGAPIGQSDREHKSIALIEYLADGSKRMQGTFNEKNNITGTETFFYPSGKVFETDEYVDGQEQGPSIAFYPDGTKKNESQYANGKLNGYHQLWYSNGQLREGGWYTDNDACGYWLYYNDLGALTDSIYYNQGTETGTKGSFLPNGRKEYEIKTRSGWLQEWKQFDSTGRLLEDLHFPDGTGRLLLVYPDNKRYIEGQYSQGKLQGPYTIYYPDDRKMVAEFYVKGLRDSSYKAWFHSGLVSSEGHYSYGYKSGTWKDYYANGKVKSEEAYTDGKQNGKETDYTEDGKIETEVMYKDDQKTGLFKKFDPDGTLAYQVMYKDNKPISYTWLDKDGHLLPETPILKESGQIRTWFPNGKVSAEFGYSDGFLDGVSKLYFTNGQLRNQHVYKYGDLYDHYIIYFNNGQLRADYIYQHDNLQGPYKEYNEKGVLTETGSYYDGQAHGLVRLFDDKGNPKETYLYYYGKLLSVK
jgi:antitoxin component YwqK of YwqJK toxin-antitoxin module/Tfp pilus assembly protein PilF